MDEFENDNPPLKIGDESRILRYLDNLRSSTKKISHDINNLNYVISKLEDRKKVMVERQAYELQRIDELEELYGSFAKNMAQKAQSRINRETYPLRKEIRALRKENERLSKLANVQEKAYDSVEQEAIAKARTIAIFESILFAIENWATDDAPASDFTPVAQAVLFKAVYDRVMSGVTDYYLDEVPFAATEVVKRGREYVKGIRAESQVPLTEMTVTAQEYQQWWINDALVLLYGDRDPDWETTKPHTREEMEKWKSTDMDKTMNFPKIFDAFELTRKYGDEIRESSGLPEFTKQIMQTRLTAHE